jgi:hypothetical protein
MSATLAASNFYSGLAVGVLDLHGLFILWVVFGTILTRSRLVLRWLHITGAPRGKLQDREAYQGR